MASISRWTLAFFGCALTCLVIALALMSAGFGYPRAALMAPQTLIVVHLVAIGWLTLLMLGALLQFLPVLVGGPLHAARWAPLVLLLLAGGLLLLLVGFAVMDGWDGLPPETLPLGGLLLLAGLCLAAVMLFTTLLNSSVLPPPAAFVAVAVMSMLVAALLGTTLTGAIAGLIGGDFATAVISYGVPLHAGFGLGGWLTLAAMGVSYRLVSMFLVAPERTGRTQRLVLGSGVTALIVLGLGLATILATNAPLPLTLGIAALTGLGGISAYACDIAALYRQRRRQRLELHMGAALGAFILLPLGAVWLVVATLADSEAGIAAAIYVLALGWLGGLGLAMLYKIIPFLTWLECFAPFMGREPTPRVQDLVCERKAAVWFGLYFAALLLGSVALQGELAQVFQLATGLQLLAVLLLMRQFYRARRLADLPTEWCHHARPRLFLPRQRRFS